MLKKVKQDKPKRVGNYQVGSILGKGAIGTVYKGEHVETGEVVAIKLVSTVSIKEKYIKSIKNEMYLLKRLKHENIVKYIDFIQTEYHYAIILEYIESGSLDGIIKKFGPFQESLVIIFIKQVLRGLEYLHRQGIVHRDIKGANILSTKNSMSGVIKLTDFGVATHLADDDKSHTFVGTPFWMAPEVIIDSDGHITTSCDIWSLGCTIIELLTGNPPYSDGNQFSALFRMVSDPHPPLPKDVSPLCIDFLMQCFNREASQRMDAKNLLNHDWIKTNIDPEMLQIINSPNPELPEEVLNSIRNHINESQIELDPSSSKHGTTKFDNNIEKSLLQDQQFTNSKRVEREIKDLQENQGNFTSALQQSITQSLCSLNHIHIVQQKERLVGLKLQPESIRAQPESNRNVNLFYDEGSFAGSMVENKPLDSLRNYNNMKKKNNYTINSKREQKMYQDTQEIVNGLSKTREPKKVEEYMNYLSDIIIRFPKAKDYFIKQSGLTLFIDLFDKFSTNLPIIQSVLSFLNQIVENEMYYLETACLFGVIPQILKFTSNFYPREIRFEVSNFIAQLFMSSATLQIFLACGGCQALVDLLETDVNKNKEIIQIGSLTRFLECLLNIQTVKNKQTKSILFQNNSIDMILMLSEVQFLSYQNLCRMLIKYDICQKIVLIFYGLIEDYATQNSLEQNNNDLKLIQKTVDLLLLFAKCEDKQMKVNICQDETVQILIEILDTLAQQENNIYCNQLLHLSNEHNLLNKLENLGLIKRVLNLLDVESRKQNTIDEVFLDDLLKIINYFQNLSHPRQEHLVLIGALPVLKTITSKSSIQFHLRKTSLAILCNFVKTSPLTRKKLVEYGGPHIFLGFLQLSEECNQQFSFKILDTLASWLVIDLELLESFFFHNIKFFIQSPNNQLYLLQIIPIIYRIISLSDRIAQVMACQEEFIESLCCLLTDFEENISQNTNTPQIKKKILEFLHCLLMRSDPKSVCDLVEKHDLNTKLHYIKDKSSELEIIILEEISQNLLDRYDDSKAKCNQLNFGPQQNQNTSNENKPQKQQDPIISQQMQRYKMNMLSYQNNQQNIINNSNINYQNNPQNILNNTNNNNSLNQNMYPNQNNTMMNNNINNINN